MKGLGGMLSRIAAPMFLAMALLTPTGAATPEPTPVPTENPVCLNSFHAACSEAIGAWLPVVSFSSDPLLAGHAKRLSARDGFVYENEKPSAPEFLGYQGPDDGTFFAYGDAGPPKGRVVYDYRHHVAFYEQGCCSWHDVVAAEASPPPKRVVSRDLTALRAVRGISLGMTIAAVTAIDGAARPYTVPQLVDMQVLSYTTCLQASSVNVPLPYGQNDNFFFLNGRLVLIQFGNGC
jgi:hypothetical protein